MKPTEKTSKFDVIYDKLKLLNHKVYEMKIKIRDMNTDDPRIVEWENHESFVKDAMMVVDDGRGSDLTKNDFIKMNNLWNECKHINV